MLEIVLEPGATERELAAPLRRRRATDACRCSGRWSSSCCACTCATCSAARWSADAERVARRAARRARPVVVAFADLVGFTRLGEEIAPEELGSVADRLDTIAGEVVEPPVRLVKTIGDAVMLVADEPAALARSRRWSCSAAGDARGEDFPQLRVGLAYGPAVARGGDWFGRPVNLASRVTTVARAGSVLVTEDVRDAAAATASSWSYARARRHSRACRGRCKLFARARARAAGADRGQRQAQASPRARR